MYIVDGIIGEICEPPELNIPPGGQKIPLNIPDSDEILSVGGTGGSCEPPS